MIRKPLSKVVITLIVVLISSVAVTEAAVNDVAEEFNLFCTLYQLASKGSELSDLTYDTEWTTMENQLVAYNLSVSEDKFYVKDFGRELVPDKEDATYAAYAARSKALKEKIDKGQAVECDRKVRRAAQTYLAAAARSILNNTIKDALKLHADLKDEPKETDIKANLDGAIYGKGRTTIDTGGSDTTWSSVNAACGALGGATDKSGASLVNDMLCICGMDRTDGGKQCGGSGLSEVSFTGAASAQTEFNKLPALFHKDEGLRLASSALNGAVTV
uniref:Variant surface glycoprotein 1845 n=1 Tax=Trypanosoma brucei TaxID=5691 RepID=M4SWI1_9TRYP|nr:variant surface glycoprotein 1845 [Trypanosoma brucei]